MSTGRDDDDAALSWGDEDPTLDTGTPATAVSPTLPDGYTAVGKGSAEVHGEADAPAVAEPPASATPASAPLGNVALVSLGILGGVYLLFTVGWIIGGLRLQDVAVFLVAEAAYIPAFWVAVLAPAIWFGVTYLLTRRSAAWVRFAWLVAGAALFVPWPFIMIGAIGR